MAHKTEGDCPTATAIFIRRQAKKREIALEEAIEIYAEEADRPVETIRDWVWPRKHTVKIHSKDKPMKTHTKQEVKIQISKIADEIKAGNVSDDDAKIVGDALAEAVDNKVASPRVISRSVTSFKKSAGKVVNIKTQKSLVESMVDLSHNFVNRLDQVKSRGPSQLTKSDHRMINDEFKYIIPRMLRILTEMGLDLSAILDNYVIPLKEVTHESDAQE